MSVPMRQVLSPPPSDTTPPTPWMSIQEDRHEELRVTLPEEPQPNSKNGYQTPTQFVYRNGTSNALAIEKQLILPTPPQLSETREYFRAIQKWEGHVFEVGRDTFHAVLVPITGQGAELEAEINLEEIQDDDRTLIEPGAVFYWSIGYLNRPSGRLNASIIRFRRLPVWTGRQISEAITEAEKLQALFDNE